MAMKITNRNSRIDKAGKHNDRNFDLDKASHIDQNKVHLNRYYTYNGDTTKTFEEVEKEFYERHFGDKIELQNNKNTAERHPERNKTVEDYYHGKRTRPEDKILQIGNFFDHVDGYTLWECALQYAKEFDEKFGDHCKIVDMALHMDEATPHVHVRRVWIAEDELGNEYVSQTKALEQMGFGVDTNKKISQYNNRKISFTATDREMFLNICREHNLDIDYSGPGSEAKHLETNEFKLKNVQNLMEKEEELIRTIKSLENEKEQLDLTVEQLKLETEDQIEPILQMFYENEFLLNFTEDLERIKKEESKIKQLNLLNALYKEKADYVFKGDVELALVRVQVEKELSLVENFLEKYGLTEKFKEYREQIDNDKSLDKNRQQDRSVISK